MYLSNINEWDGQIDMMKLIEKMNKFKKKHEDSFKQKFQNDRGVGNPHGFESRDSHYKGRPLNNKK